MTGRRKKEFPGATPYRDRHGKRRWRFRKKNFSAELGSEYGSPEFVRRYEEAMTGLRSPSGAGNGKTVPRSISDIIAKYYQTADFLGLKSSTKTTYRNMLERFREEHGHKSAAKLERRHLKAIFAAKSETPAAANNLRDRLKALLDLAVDLEWRKDNPIVSIKPLKVRSKGFHTWSEAEIDKFYAKHSLGTLAHTAMTLMLFTGAARADAVKLGKGNIRHRDYIDAKRLKQVTALEAEDVQIFQNGFKKCCDFVDAHDPSRGHDAEPPEPIEILADIQILKDWSEALRGKMNSIT